MLLQGGFTPAPANASSSSSSRAEIEGHGAGEGHDAGFDDPLGRHIDVDMEYEASFGRRARRVAIHEQGQEPLEQSRANEHDVRDRKPSDASTSLSSSQLSHVFVNSPAVAVSTYQPNVPANTNAHASSSVHPTAHQHQQSQLHHTLQSHTLPHAHPNQPQPTYIPPPPPPPASYTHLHDAPFTALVEETRSVLASADFRVALEACLDRAVEVLFEGLEGNVFRRVAGEGANEEGGEGGEAERVRLAGLLPGLARWSQLAMEGLPNELVDVSILLSFFAPSCCFFAFCRVLIMCFCWDVTENPEYARGIVFVCDRVWEV